MAATALMARAQAFGSALNRLAPRSQPTWSAAPSAFSSPPFTHFSSKPASPSLGGFLSLLKFPSLNGGPAILPEQMRGKVVLLVNTASYCGYTPQLTGLQALQIKLGQDGLSVLAVPSNDFGAQEPDQEEKIEQFYREKYGATYCITSKQRVVGAEAHPGYRWLQDNLGDAGSPSWNFSKYLVSRKGELAGVFAPAVDPTDPELLTAIESELKKPGPV